MIRIITSDRDKHDFENGWIFDIPEIVFKICFLNRETGAIAVSKLTYQITDFI